VVAFTQALPIFLIAIDLLGCCVSAVDPCGWLLHFIDVSASEVYRLTPDKLGQVCFGRGMCGSGPARALLQRLSEQFKSTKLQTPPDEVSNQTGVRLMSVIGQTPRFSNL